ncbi:condensation domain-containing protein, partial [Photobacterium minamisatsumaniensis]|uniref:condensation domain-containing protein n=1 Tax=Photobacterium minamisatsumaniensis TaxID=2910233 RepID=UPI003D0BF0F1
TDFQVKLRGFRIELGEIETCLLQHPSFNQAVVQVAGKPEKLVAYLVTGKGVEGQSAIQELKKHVQQHLPAYMQPSVYQLLDKLPLTPNGKINRKALPTPDSQQLLDNVYTAPETEKEIKLSKIWSTLLGQPQIGREDNFFELGGDSLSLIMLKSECVRQEFDFDLNQFRENATLKHLAQLTETPPLAIPKINIDLSDERKPMELLSLPNRYEMQECIQPGRDHLDLNHWNALTVLEVTHQDFNLPALKHALATLYQRHDSLRVSMHISAGRWREHIRSDDSLLPFSQLTFTEQIPDIITHLKGVLIEIQKDITLASSPVHFCLVSYPKHGKHYLLNIIHHLLADGHSLNLMFDELSDDYGRALTQPTSAVTKAVNDHAFIRYTQGLQAFCQSPQAQEQLDFIQRFDWQGHSPMNKDHTGEDHNNIAKDDRRISVTLAREEVLSIKNKLQSHRQLSLRVLVLDAILHQVSKRSCSEKVLIDVQKHGRNELGLALDMSRTVGYFTEMFSIPFTLNNSGTPIQQVQQTATQFSEFNQRASGFPLLKYCNNELSTQRFMSSLTTPEVAINFQLEEFSEPEAINSPWFNPRFDDALELDEIWRSEQLMRKNLWYIIYTVRNGELEITFTYNHHHFKEETMHKVGDDTINHIRHIVDHL